MKRLEFLKSLVGIPIVTKSIKGGGKLLGKIEHNQCCSCGKDLTICGGSTYAFLSIHLGGDGDLVYPKEGEMAHHAGRYNLNKEYKFCPECVLDALGAKP